MNTHENKYLQQIQELGLEPSDALEALRQARDTPELRPETSHDFLLLLEAIQSYSMALAA